MGENLKDPLTMDYGQMNDSLIARLLSAIFAIQLGFLSILTTWLILALPILALFGIGGLMFSAGSVVVLVAGCVVVAVPLLLWFSLRFFVPSYLAVVRLAFQILAGASPARPSSALKLVAAHREVLWTDLRKICGRSHA